MKFNEKLIELRKKAGLSQEELGYKLNVTRQTVSKWELSQTTPEMDKLVEMSKIFNVSVDELVNETEKVSTESTLIEDQTIREEGAKENKVKLIIIGILLVVLICIVVKMVMGFTAFNKLTEEQGLFDKFFSLFNKVSSQQQNIMGDAEGIFSNVQNMMGEAFEKMGTTEFNSTFKLYQGSKKGTSVKRLLDEVITSNKTKNKKIIIKFSEKETQETEEIKNIKTNIKDRSNYEVALEYDNEGYIYQVIIERVFSELEKKSFNNSFEMYAGNKGGLLVILALDNIITSNKTEERLITVKYEQVETQDEEEIKNIRRSIDKIGDYELSFEYDANGFINKAIIEKL